MKRFALILAALAATGFAAQAGELRLYGHAEYFSWKETFKGETYVEETGALSGAGLEYAWRGTNGWGAGILVELFGGEVDYDGGIQLPTGEFMPVESDTVYFGTRIEGRLFRDIARGKATWTPEAGVGLRMWVRDFESEASAEVEDAAYKEYWFDGYGFLGVGGKYSLSAKSDVHARVRVKLPMGTAEYIDASNNGGPDDIELEPEAQVGWQAEAGATIKGLEIDLFVETLDYDQSDLDEETETYFQPDSEALLVGVKLGARI